MPDEKDRLGDKLRDLEHGREDQYFARRDRELIERLRHQQEVATPGSCPMCSKPLSAVEEGALTGRLCDAGHGIWLTAKEFESVAVKDEPDAVRRILGRMR